MDERLFIECNDCGERLLIMRCFALFSARCTIEELEGWMIEHQMCFKTNHGNFKAPYTLKTETDYCNERDNMEAQV